MHAGLGQADVSELVERGARLLSALPEAVPSVADWLGPVTCAGCGLLCDDVTSWTARATTCVWSPVCPLGAEWFSERIASARRTRRAPPSTASRPTSSRRSARAAELSARCAAPAAVRLRSRHRGGRARRGRAGRPSRGAGRTEHVAGAWPGAPARPAPRRVDGHPGRDPRPLAARRHLARGSRDHPSATARTARLRWRRIAARPRGRR